MHSSQQYPSPSPSSALLEDRQLVARAKAGDRGACELLMRRHNQRLYRVTFGILADAGAAEDAMQEAYIRAFRSLDQFGPPLQWAAWLTRIAVNEALQQRRRQHRLQVVEPTEIARLHSQQQGDAMSDPQDPQALAARQQLRGLMEEAIQQLPDNFRQVLVLRDLNQMSVAATAAALALPPATVKSRHHRARLLLRRALGPSLAPDGIELFEFAGHRCDRVVAAVMARLQREGDL